MQPSRENNPKRADAFDADLGETLSDKPGAVKPKNSKMLLYGMKAALRFEKAGLQLVKVSGGKRRITGRLLPRLHIGQIRADR